MAIYIKVTIYLLILRWFANNKRTLDEVVWFLQTSSWAMCPPIEWNTFGHFAQLVYTRKNLRLYTQNRVDWRNFVLFYIPKITKKPIRLTNCFTIC